MHGFWVGEMDDFCLVCACAAFGLQQELGEWSASSSNDQLAGEENPKFRFRADAVDLACIVCKKDIFPPVMQCQNGHLACPDCAATGLPCPACSRSLSRTRNTALDALLTSATARCKYAALGCPSRLPRPALPAHQTHCAFEPKTCTVPGCTRAGFEAHFPHHLKSHHHVDTILDLEPSEEATVSLSPGGSKVLLVHENGADCYLLHQVSTSRGELVHVTGMEEARRRRYEVVVEGDGGERLCYRSVTSGINGRLLVPKEVALKKTMCRVRLQ